MKKDIVLRDTLLLPLFDRKKKVNAFDESIDVIKARFQN